MITKRLYRDDVYMREAEAVITGSFSHEGKSLITLDQTVFFPEGGGQSSDRGTLAGIPVEHVFEKDGEIYHSLGGVISQSALSIGQKVALSIDWDHRFDNMQRHCGEHILSGIFYREYGGVNRGFHMGEDYMTVDISLEENPDFTTMTWEMAQDAELKSNEIIWQNLPMITSYFSSFEEAAAMPMRKKLSIESDISLVAIGSPMEGWGSVACCGTHPSHTGQVGMLKIFKVESNKGMFRVYFEAGRRAFLKYQKEMDTLNTLSVSLSAGPEDVVEKYRAQQEKQKEKVGELFLVKKEFLRREEEDMRNNPQLDSAGCQVRRYDILSLDDLSALGRNIGPETKKICFLVHQPTNTLFLVSDGKTDCGKLVKDNAHIYGGKGGGNNTLARAIFSKVEYVDTFIDLIEKHLR